MPGSRSCQTAGEDGRDFRVGKILNDFLDRKARGETVSEADLTAQHPDLAEDLRRHLQFLGNLEPSGDQIARLIAAGVLDKSASSTSLAGLGAYGITGFLGCGGMSFVLKAFEKNLDRTVALKILRPELTHDNHALKRFAREAKAAAGLDHPNIVTIYAVGEERGTHYLSMEFVDGPTLASVIRECGPLQHETARHLIRQILSGLGAAHRANLVHRDIKPSNILLGGLFSDSAVQSNPEASEVATFHAKIADFGLARVASAHSRITLPDSVLGTPDYMSPEQARGEEDVDHRADLYAVGVVLYEMLTGRTPFRAEKASAVIHRILHEDAPDPRAINDAADPKLASLALRLMAKRPEDRFESAGEAMGILDPRSRLTLPERRRRIARRVTALVALFVCVTGAWWLIRPLWPLPDMAGPRQQSVERPAEVRVDMDDSGPTNTLLVRYGARADWEVFHRFPQGSGPITSASLVDRTGGGDMIVAAGLRRPWNGATIFAFHADNSIAWSQSLSDASRWPDCGPPSQWLIRFLVSENLDGRPGGRGAKRAGVLPGRGTVPGHDRTDLQRGLGCGAGGVSRPEEDGRP